MQPAVMPSQTVTVPPQKPMSAPAPADMRLEGTGRTTSSASSAMTAGTRTRTGSVPPVSHSANVVNAPPKSRNGTKYAVTSTAQTMAQRMTPLERGLHAPARVGHALARSLQEARAA